ncbi:MAG: hypothetical protein FWG54_06445 [Bacteroidetes bacterium]|nr:hypothetical protein [Bacteroidota bacterium]
MRIKITLLSAVLSLCTAAFAQQNQTEPTRIRIGETIITLQSPLRLYVAETDTTEADITLYRPKTYSYEKKYPRYREESYIGFGFATPTHEATFMPIHSGNSFNFEIGLRHLYLPSRNYAIGLLLQYSCYSYRMKEASMAFMGYIPDGTIKREFFRTDNIGTGLYQRIRLFGHNSIETTVYGDFAYSKRFKVKSQVAGNKVKEKYRDSTKFNPFGAGVQIGLKHRNTTLYARYRLTNFFNPDYISPEVPRLSIGICFTSN